MGRFDGGGVSDKKILIVIAIVAMLALSALGIASQINKQTGNSTKFCQQNGTNCPYTPPPNYLTGIKAWYKLDESSGTTWVDSSGNGFSATRAGGTTIFAPGHINYALGTTTGLLQDIEYTLSIDLTWSYSEWIFYDAALLPSGNQFLFYQGSTNGPGGDGAYAIVQGTDTIQLTLTNTSPAYIQCSSNGKLLEGEWTFLTFTFDGITGKIYMNGIQDGTCAFSGTRTTPTGIFYVIGRTGNTGPGGYEDDVRIWTSSLSSTNINSLIVYYASIATN